jgi:hypothetical protein
MAPNPLKIVELRALGSTGSPADGRSCDGPAPGELADFGSALLPGRWAFQPSGLFVVDGGSQCPRGPCCAVGSSASCWEAGVLLPVEVGPDFPWSSLVFLFCSLADVFRLHLGGGSPTHNEGRAAPMGWLPDTALLAGCRDGGQSTKYDRTCLISVRSFLPFWAPHFAQCDAGCFGVGNRTTPTTLPAFPYALPAIAFALVTIAAAFLYLRRRRHQAAPDGVPATGQVSHR